jgi:D-tyrosyl-tRNA(Tyr) deacylase
VQRVAQASVVVAGETVGVIGAGLLVLVGVHHDDTVADAEALAAKVVSLRIFRDAEGKMNRSVADIGGGVLVVSQFTLYGSVRRGRRPSFTDAAVPEVAEPLVECVQEGIASAGVPVAGGRFGAMMNIALVNDGPVTLVLEVADGRVQ